MEVLINQLGLEKVGEVKSNVLLVRRQPATEDNTLMCFKMGSSEQEVRLYRDAFPQINQSGFSTLVLPQTVMAGSLMANYGWWILTPFYQGEDFPWNETHPETLGGRKIELETIPMLINMLSDLKKIPISLFDDILPHYDSASWYQSLPTRAAQLVHQGLLTPADSQRALERLTVPPTRDDLILTNGDIQFRNFKKLPDNKVVLLDWTENDYNTPNIEPIEFAVMYQWTLMWANPKWQDRYLKEASQTFGISRERMEYALLVKSLNQAHIWLDSHGLARRQIEHLVKALDGDLK